MKAHELARKLLRTPNADVMLSIDISTGEDNFDDRAFAEEIEDIQVNSSADPNDALTAQHVSVISIGHFNNRNKETT